MRRQQRGLMRSILVAVVVGVPAYLVAAISFGVPVNLLFGKLPLLNVADHYLVTSVSPENPSQEVKEITVTVKDNFGNMVPGADVRVIYKGETVFTTQTNAAGVVIFDYPGDETMLEIEKTGYRSDFVVVSKDSSRLASAQYGSVLIGLLTSIVAGIIVSQIDKVIAKKHR